MKFFGQGPSIFLSVLNNYLSLVPKVFFITSSMIICFIDLFVRYSTVMDYFMNYY